MKLDRNSGLGKYALINLRELPIDEGCDENEISFEVYNNPDSVQMGPVGSPDEFFVIKLKDRFAQAALNAYADAAEKIDPEYAEEIRQLAKRSGPSHPNCKFPD